MSSAPPLGRESPGPALAIETRALTKRFGRQLAVDGLDLQVPTGSVFGFLGPNGSGKTSTIRVLLGLTQASSGDVRILGGDMPASLRSQGPLAELRAQGVQRVTVTTPDGTEAASVLSRLGLDPAPAISGITAEVPADGPAPERINAALVEGGVRVRGFQVAGASLEDRFVDLTGEGFDVAG